VRTAIRRVYEANFRVCGVRNIRRQLKRGGERVAGYTVARPMNLQGAVRGKRVKTMSDSAPSFAFRNRKPR
jgi:putative transposase